MPEGEAGELFVGGDCLARGYVNLPEKTEESFPEDPFSSEIGARMYRTGDRARILADGTLEILGRVDFMVKIRGYSVELGAVEAAVEKNLAVRACVVVSEGEEGEDKRLVAYLVPDPEDGGGRFAGWSLDPKTGRSKEIRGVLQEDLPHYAIPAVFVELESLPIHATSGKVDRAELPTPPPRPARTTSEGATPVTLPAGASRSEKEDLLARIWEEVLRLERGRGATRGQLLRPRRSFTRRRPALQPRRGGLRCARLDAAVHGGPDARRVVRQDRSAQAR